MSFKLNAIIIAIFFIIQIFNAIFNTGYYYYCDSKRKYNCIALEKRKPKWGSRKIL